MSLSDIGGRQLALILISFYDIRMSATPPQDNLVEDIQHLAEFRYRLRKFLHFSETAATREGLTPQQHQLLLQIAGAPAGTLSTVGFLAERLVLRHHTVVELGNRCEQAGLIARKTDPQNHRHVVLELTPAGIKVLRKLSEDHRRELNELGPQLVQTLRRLTR